MDASLNPIENYRYTAFGETEVYSYQSINNPWRYSGKRFDSETGFTYFGRRYYASDIGRWITPDPAGFEDGLNLYTYVHNSPLIYVDPDGQLAFLLPFVVSMVVNVAIDYALPAAAALVEEYAGGTIIAAAATGFAKGYTGDYTVSDFADNANLGWTGRITMGLGTILAHNPSKVTQKATKTAASEVCSQVANQTLKQATKTGVNATGRKVAQETVSSTTEKASKIARQNFVAKEMKQNVSKKGTDVIHVTPQGVAIPCGSKYQIPKHYIENEFRDGSYGELINGKFFEKLRIDPATVPGKKGPNYSHYHLNNKGTHHSPLRGDTDPGFNI